MAGRRRPAGRRSRCGERLLGGWRTPGPPLVVEDAHWIDSASADVLRFLGRRIAGTGGLLVVTARDELAADDPCAVLGDLARGRGRIEVAAAVGRAAVAGLVGAPAWTPTPRCRLTGGNAFLVTQLCRRAGSAASLAGLGRRPDRAGSAPVARGAGRAAGRRARAARPAGLLGDDWQPASTSSAGRAAHVDDEMVEFRHELVRLAVEHEPAARPAARQLHARCWRRLPRPTPSRRRSRTTPAARQGAAASWPRQRDAPRAARAAAFGSHREAAEHYRRAVAGVPAPQRLGARPGTGCGRAAARADDAELWSALSREECLSGHDEAALDAAPHAVTRADDDPLRSGRPRWLAQPDGAAEARAASWPAAVELLAPLGPSPELTAAAAPSWRD